MATVCERGLNPLSPRPVENGRGFASVVIAAGDHEHGLLVKGLARGRHTTHASSGLSCAATNLEVPTRVDNK